MSKYDDPLIHTFGVMLEAVTRLNRTFDRSLKDQTGLPQGWFEALLRIERSGGFMSMGELAEQISITSGGVTRLVDRMTEAGLVERRACETDRRVQYVANTKDGRNRLDKALEVHLVDLSHELDERMTERERQTIVKVMERLREPAPQDIRT